MKKSLEKWNWKNVPEENGRAKILHKHGRQIAGIAAKEQTCVPYNRDRNRYRSKFEKKNRRRSKN